MKISGRSLVSIFLAFTFIALTMGMSANASFAGRANIGDLVISVKFSDQEDPAQEDMKRIQSYKSVF